MEKEFVPCVESLSLRELGFDDKCFGAYNNKYKLQTSSSDYWDNQSLVSLNDYFGKSTYRCLAPTFSQALRWFREKYGLSASILLKMRNSKRVSFYIISELDNRIIKSKFFNSKISGLYKTYEEAERECLKKLIQIAQKQNKNAN